MKITEKKIEVRVFTVDLTEEEASRLSNEIGVVQWSGNFPMLMDLMDKLAAKLKESE